MSKSDFNILIGVDMTDAKGQIEDTIENISKNYPLKLSLIIANKDKMFKQIRTIQNLFKTLGKIDVDFGLSEGSKELLNINNALKTIAKSDLTEIGDDFAKSLEGSKKKIEQVRQAYESLMKVTDKANGDYKVQTVKTGDKFANTTKTTGVKDDGSFFESAPINVRDFEALNNYVNKSLDTIDSMTRISKEYSNELSELAQRLTMLHSKLSSGDDGFNKERKEIQKLIEYYNKLEQKMIETEKVREHQAKQIISWDKKIEKMELDAIANPLQRSNVKSLFEGLKAGTFQDANALMKVIADLEKAMASVEKTAMRNKFRREKNKQVTTLDKKVVKESKLLPEFTNPEDQDKLNKLMERLRSKDTDNQVKLANVINDVNKQYDEMLKKQRDAIEKRKLEVQEAEDLARLQKHLQETEKASKLLDAENEAKKTLKAQRIANVVQKEKELSSFKAPMIGSGLIEDKEFEHIENKLQELGRIAKKDFVDNLEVHNQLKEIDQMMAKIKERFDDLDAKQRQIRASQHDWGKEIERIKSQGFVNESEFKGVREAMRNLSADANTYEKDLKRVQQQIARMNVLSEKRKDRQETREITRSRNDAKIETMRGSVPDYILNNVKSINSLMDFSTSKKDMALIEDEMKRLVNLQHLITQAGKDKQKYDEAIAEYQQRAVKFTDKMNDSLAEVLHKSERQIQDEIKKNQIGQEALSIQRQINELRERGTEISYEEQRAIQQQMLALRQLAQRQRDVETQTEDERLLKRRVESRFESNAYRATRGFDNINSPQYAELSETIKNIREMVTGLGDLTGRELREATENIENEMSKLNRRSAELRDEERRRRQSFDEQLKNALKKVPVWTTATMAVYGSINQIQQGFQQILEIDKSMIALQKVTEASKNELEDFKTTASDMGRELGVVASEVIKATTDFQKLGYTLEESTILGKNSILYANVGDMSIEDAGANIVSTIKGFNIEVDKQGNNIRNVVDMFNEVSNNYAISAEGIGEGLKRSSAVMKEAGNTIEESIGLLTAANAVIQDPKKVGNGLKTIAMRLRGVGEEGENLTALVPQLQSTFERLNKEFGLMGDSALKLMEDDGTTFKSTYEIFKNIQKVWNKLSDMERANLVETMGGKHQGVIVASIINNWNDAETAMETAMQSAGSASREFEAYMDGFEYRIGQLKNALERFWTTLIDEEAVKDLISALTSIVDTLTWAVENIGGSELFAIIGGLFTFFGSKKLRDAMGSIGSLTTLFTSLRGGIASVAGMIPRLLPYIGILWGIGEATSFIVGWMNKEKDARREKLKQLDEEISKLEEAKKKYEDTFDGSKKNDLLDRYGVLQKKGESRTPEEEEEFKRMTRTIEENMPELISHYNKYREAVIMSAEAIKKLRIENEQLLLSADKDEFETKMKDIDFGDIDEKLKQTNEAYESLQSSIGGVKLHAAATEFVKNEMKDFQRGTDEYEKQMDSFKKKMQETWDNLPDPQKKDAGWLNGILHMTYKNKEAMLKSLDQMDNYSTALNASYQKAYEDAKASMTTGTDELNKMIDQAFSIATRERGIEGNTNTFKFIDDLRKLMESDVSEFGNSSEEIIGQIPALIDNAIKTIKDNGMSIDELVAIDPETSTKTIDSINRIIEALNQNPTENSNLLKMLVELRKAHQDALTEFNNKPIKPFLFDTDAMGEVKTFINDISDLDSAYRTLADGEELSLSTTMDLIAQHPELIKHLESENGVLKLTAKSIKAIAKDREDAFKKTLEMQRISREQAMKTAQTEMEAAIKTAEALRLTLEARRKAMPPGYNPYNIVAQNEGIAPFKKQEQKTSPFGLLTSDGLSKGLLSLQAKQDLEAKKQADEADELAKFYQKQADEAAKDIENLKKLYNQDWTSQLGNITGGGKKDKKDLQDAIYVVDKYRKKMDDLNRAIAKQQQIQAENSQWTAAYKNAVSEEIRYTNDKKKAIDAEIASLEEQIRVGRIAQTGLIQLGQKDDNKTARAKAAEIQQQIDQADDRLRELKAETQQVDASIQELQWKNVEAQTSLYNIQREMLSDDIAYQEYLMGLYDEASQTYRDHAAEKLSLVEEQMKYHQEELAWLEREKVANKDLSNAQINNINEMIRAKREAIYDMAKLVSEIETLIASSKLEQFLYKMTSESNKYADQISEIEDKIKYDLDEDKDYAKHIEYLKEIISLRKGEQQDIVNNIKYLEEQLSIYKNNKEMVEKITAELEEQKSKLKDTGRSIKDVNLQIKQVYEKLADEYVDLYKEQLELMQKADEKYYDNKIKAEEKAHEKRMKQIEKEMDALQEAYDKQMKMIDRAESKRTYDNNLERSQAEINEIKKQIDLLSMDDSYEAKSKKAELVKELTQKELDLAELKHDRDVELRKDNLEDDLDAEQEKLENRKDKYEEETQALIDSLEEQKELRNEYWEAQLNDEKKFAEMRQEVLDGNFADMLETISDWTDDVNDHMGEIGESITENFIYKLEEAKRAIQELRKVGGGGFGGLLDQIPSTDLDGDEKPSSGGGNTNPVDSKEIGIIKQMKKNSEAWTNATTKEEKQKYYEANQKLGKSIGATYVNGTWYKDGKLLYDKLIGLKTGGYTGNWSGDNGKLALLHKKELVLNEEQTRNILDTARIVEKIKANIPNIGLLSKIPTKEPETTTSAGIVEHNEYNIEVTINGNADKKIADTVADQMVNKIKRTKGGRF